MAGTLRDKPSKPKGGTLRGKPGKSPGSQKSAPDSQPKVLKKELRPTELTEITLGGVTYSIDGLISDSSGEAQIYKLSKSGQQYALKLYFVGISPDPAVIEILQDIKGTGFLVDILDYGTWQSPQGELRDYEIQPYYSGGELSPGELCGNNDGLKMAAVSMMMAIHVAHTHNILHRDIKPGNFFYADETRSQLVLADFGIASAFNRDAKGKMIPLKKYEQNRTKVYASPEIYTVIEGEVQYDDEKSDYYALGMSLLTLWGGDQQFEALDERALLRIKKRRRNEGNALPIPEDMDPALQRLVMGLTVPDPEHRWGYEEFERWLKGEAVAIDGEVASQGDGTPQFSFLWSGSKNQTAHSLEELGAFMASDRELAAKYLYSGKISKSLADAGYPELQMEVDDYISKVYPKNHLAGVMITAYLLNADLPYYSPTGKELSSQAEIAEDMANNAPKYLDEVAAPDSLLYVYFRASGQDRASTFTKVAKEKNQLTALWRLIFLLDPSQGFPLLDVNDNRYYRCTTVEELVEFFANQPEQCYTDSNSAYPDLLYDEAFTLWLSHRNEALAGKVQSALAQEKNSKGQLYYYIFYLLAPERNFFMGKSHDSDFTLEQVAFRLNDDLMQYYVIGRHENNYKQHYLDRVNELVDLKDNRLYYYLKSKGIYKDKFDYIAYCFDINSDERKKAAGPYNLEIALFKALKALNDGTVGYYFPKSKKTVSTIDELDSIPADEKLDELRNGLLKWWLAVQYHEDPYADLSEDYAYENLLNDYTWKLCDIDDENEEAERLADAYTKVDDGANKIKRMLRGNYLWRAVFMLLIAFPLLAVACAAAFGGTAEFARSSLWGYALTAAFFLVPLRFVQSIGKVDEWLLQPFGEKLGNDLLLHRWIVSAIYLVAIFGFCYILERWGAPLLGRILIPAAAFLVLAWRYKITIKDYPLMRGVYDDAINPGFEALGVEPLFYAWKDKGTSKEFDSETLDRQQTYYEGIKAARYFCITRTLWSLIPTALIIGIYIAFSPITESIIKEKDPARWEKIYGEGSKITADENQAVTEYYADVKKSLSVRKSPSANAGKLGSLAKNEKIDVIAIEDGWAKIRYADGIAYVNSNYIKPVSDTPVAVASEKSDRKEKPANTSKESQDEIQPSNSVMEENQKVSSAPEKVQPAKPKVFTILHNYNSIDVFSAKNTQSQFVIGNLTTGDSFEVLSNDGTWSKILFNGRDAYVKSSLIEPVENSTL